MPFYLFFIFIMLKIVIAFVLVCSKFAKKYSTYG